MTDSHISSEPSRRLSILGCWTHSGVGPTTSFLYEDDDLCLLMDSGVDPVGEMRRIRRSPVRITHVFISHVHSDHSSGLANLIFTRRAMAGNMEESAPPLAVIGSSETVDAMQLILKAQYPERSFDVDWQEVNSGTTLSIGGSAQLAFSANDHTVETLSCRLVNHEQDVSFGFQADTRPLAVHKDFFREVKVLIAECFDLGLDSEQRAKVNARGHSTAHDAAVLAQQTSAQILIPYHLPAKYRDSAGFRAQLLDLLASSSAAIVDPMTTSAISMDSPDRRTFRRGGKQEI